nr:DUF4290 domain-containing protein [Saprospiraceae bacterium]
MEYNSQKEKLVIPEYGRHIQGMILYLKKVENKEERQVFAEEIINLMSNINPQNKQNQDEVQRLWNHLFRIAGFDLDVTPPTGEIPTPDSVIKHPVKPSYNQTKIKYRHYGNYIQKMVNKAIEEKDPDKQKEFLNVIGSYMKLAYKTWNPEHYVSDEIILGDLKNLCRGKIEFIDDIQLDALSSSKTSRRQKSANPPVKSKGGRKRKGGARKKRR